MWPKTSAIALATLYTVVPATAQSQHAAREKACLTQQRLYSYQPLPGNRSLLAIDTARRRYRVNFYGICPSLQFQFGLAFQTKSVGTLSCIQRGDAVLLSDPVGPNRCLIKDVQFQTPEMDRADAELATARRHAR